MMNYFDMIPHRVKLRNLDGMHADDWLCTTTEERMDALRRKAEESGVDPDSLRWKMKGNRMVITQRRK